MPTSRRPPVPPAAVPRGRPRDPDLPGRPVATVGTRGGRILALTTAILVVFGAIAVRLVDVQALHPGRYVAVGRDQITRTVTFAADRGSIFDRNGADLAISVRLESIWADPQQIDHPAEVAAALGPIVGIDEVLLRERLSQRDRAFVWVARKVDPDVSSRVHALDLPGIGFTPESKRYYPAGDLAAPVLGFVGLDNVGLSGLEYGHDASLAGAPGEAVIERDPRGYELPTGPRDVKPAVPGRDLVLTIDRSLQYELERALTDGVSNARALGGMAIIADVRTGDILAMATVNGPTTEQPAQPAGDLDRNRPITDVFEPGSTNKVITIAAAIEEGLVSPTTELDVPQSVVMDGIAFSDVEQHAPTLTVADILRESSNVGTIGIADQLGKQRFDHYLRAFGFGALTGVDFPGESPGILLPVDHYNATSMASMPIGSGIAVTALQMLDVYMTIANGGVSRAPRLVAATIDAQGRRVPEPSAPGHRVISEATATKMGLMLEDVVNAGTGTKASIPGYRVAGKTGTARKPPYDKPPYNYVASFVGFAPVDSPRLAAIVVLDQPRGNYFGGEVSAPIFARAMRYALALEQVPPTGSRP